MALGPLAVARVLVSLWVWGLRVCSLDVAFASATVCSSLQPSASRPYGRASGEFGKSGPVESSSVVQLRFAWQARHFATFQHVSYCVENRLIRGRRNTFTYLLHTFTAVCKFDLSFSWQAKHS